MGPALVLPSGSQMLTSHVPFPGWFRHIGVRAHIPAEAKNQAVPLRGRAKCDLNAIGFPWLPLPGPWSPGAPGAESAESGRWTAAEPAGGPKGEEVGREKVGPKRKWVWRKIQELGQTAGFSLWFLLPRWHFVTCS